MKKKTITSDHAIINNHFSHVHASFWLLERCIVLIDAWIM